MNTLRYALFCLDSTHIDGCEGFARKLIEEHGLSILSVGDVADYLNKKDIPNIQVNMMLDGVSQRLFSCVTTLSSMIHAGLLANREQIRSFDLSDLCQIDLAYVTLNETELRNERNRVGRTLESCRRLIDVQGPALLHSTVHAGKIAVSSLQWEKMALEALHGDVGAHSRLNHCAMTAVSGYYQEIDRVYLTFFQNKESL